MKATSTEGVFTGAATGPLAEVWSVDMLHTVLSGNPETAHINGGNFQLATVLNCRPALVTGIFEGGFVKQTGGARTGCFNQTYDVEGILGDVGISGRGDKGTGNFSATLTHYRHKIFGYCVTYSASISGTVNLSF